MNHQKKHFLFFVTILVITMTDIINAEPVRMINMAVMTLKVGSGVESSDADLITDRLNAELFKTKRANILERGQINEILKEQGFQKSGACTDEGCLVEMGQLLGVEQLVSGSIGKLGDLWVVNIRVIDVATGKIIRIVSRDVSGGIEDLFSNLRDIALILTGLKKVNLQPLPNMAMLVITSEPDSLPVILNGKKVGFTPYSSNELPKGKAIVRIIKKDFEPFIDTVDLNNGKKTVVVASMTSIFGTLYVKSTPKGAKITLNDSVKTGVTPIFLDRIKPGPYTLKLQLPKHKRFKQSIIIKKNVNDTADITLSPISKKIARLIFFGLVSGGFTGAGIYYDSEVQRYQNNADIAYSNYQSANLSTTEYTKNYEEYTKNVNKAEDAALLRNVFFGIGGTFSIGFWLSIPF